MTRFTLCLILLGLGLLTIACQTHKPATKADPAYDLQQAQAREYTPVQTPIPSSASDQPIVITELSANDAASLSDGMMDETPKTKAPVTQPVKPQNVIVEPDQSNTMPMAQTVQPQTTSIVTVNKGPSYTALARSVQSAQGMWKWTKSRCVQTDIQISFGGKVVLNGTMLTDRAAGKVRLTYADGTVIVYDGQQVWMSPANAPISKPRFDALTWAYFLTAPFKLNDAGTHLQSLGNLPLVQGRNMAAAKLTFNPGVGDSPDDWYIVYVDPQSRWLRGMAYIVTYGKSVTEAEKNPHAITYDNYVNLAGVILPRTWTFWNWSQDQGIIGQPLGSATLSNLQMVYPATNSFTQPEGAVLCEAPR